MAKTNWSVCIEAAVLSCVSAVCRYEGVGGLYKGLVPNTLRVLPSSAITFMVYEAVTKWLS
jgi:solute carrier family 25 folate transporter 32